MKKFDVICSLLILFLLLWTGFKWYSNKLEQNPHVFDLISSSKIKQLETHYQENSFFRNYFLEQVVTIKKILGIRKQNEVYFGKDGYLLVNPKKIKQEETLISSLNQFYQTHNDITMSLLLLPSHMTVNPSLVDKDTPIFDEYEQMKRIYHKIAFNTIDVVPTLKKGMNEYPIYYHLDSHLTSYGAYYVYQRYAELNDIVPLSISDFDIKLITDNFSGDLITRAHTYSWKKDSIVFFHPKKEPRLEVQYEDKKTLTLYDENELSYSYFLGAQEPWLHITNLDLPMKPQLLIIKDDSANAIIPFLTNHYSDIHVIDVNYYKKSISNYIHENKGIREVLFLIDMN